ncbi:heavy metal translocating P-type ATPase [Loktanella sp. M215]|uniref:heavy metal translocating P-type ATPase n=1 Tax=Loktanella sp. M215 TaxID=2675431 RepID=UPI001F2EBE45|nr:heavy metal translocating P-type ATPase [Loktanella sp. M215]MCF7697888.1 copper-translocating P-type ATPase [Loktanella sp. M215]
MMSGCPACAAAPMALDTAQGPALQFSVPGVHCAACIGQIERGLAHLNGIASVRVNLSMKRLSVTGRVAPAAVLGAVTGLGFEVYPLDAASLDAGRDDVGRTLLVRLAVAGFAMMNVMLLSVAVWAGAAGATRDMFHMISAAIALPAVAYAGQPFFVSALSALRAGRLNMDVPISLAILLASAMSLFETFQGGTHAYFDAALSLTFFLLIGRYMDHRTRSAARSAARELTALEVQTAERLIGDVTETVAVTALAAGDLILVPSGARVAVDGLLESDGALLDRSFLTGESAAVTLRHGATLHAGEVNLAAPLRVRALSVGADTSLRRMAAMVETAENARNGYTALADRAARIYAPAVHGLALLAFAGWMIATGDLRLSLNIAISVLIITCPCALGLAVPAVSTAAISRLFAAGFLVRHATALERLAEVTCIVFDKTGTLTRPAVALPAGMTAAEKTIAKALAQASHHPVSRALLTVLADTPAAQVTDIRELPGEGMIGRLDGAVVRLGRDPFTGQFALTVGDAAPVGLALSEALRPGVVDALAHLDLPSEIVTGDADAPASALAARLSLPVTFRATPADKLRRVHALTAAGARVLMVGDGLNDTAALAAAHASIAPSTALEASRNAADIVVLSESLADLPLVLQVARATRRLSQQNFAIAALYNAVAIPVALSGFATPLAAALAMSASSLTVLLNAQRMRWVR